MESAGRIGAPPDFESDFAAADKRESSVTGFFGVEENDVSIGDFLFSWETHLRIRGHRLLTECTVGEMRHGVVGEGESFADFMKSAMLCGVLNRRSLVL